MAYIYSAIFSITISLCLLSAIAFNDVISIDITTGPRTEAATINTIQITLWFNYTIYQHSLASPTNTHTHTITTFTNLGPSDCHKSSSNAADAKIMIENDSHDGVAIDSMAFYTTSRTWYGISARCLDDALRSAQSWLNDRSTYVKDELECESGRKNVLLCIDNEVGDCAPAKQIFYFDTTRPNEFIANASWSDATNITPEIVSCDPSKRPTNNPTFATINPTNFPSQDPSVIPTINPTVVPSTDPTAKPSTDPSHPTANPSKHPSEDPTAKPLTLQVLSTVETATSAKHEFLTDSLAAILIAILIAICGSVCLVIIITLIIGAMWKKKESERSQQDQTILQGDDVKTAESYTIEGPSSVNAVISDVILMNDSSPHKPRNIDQNNMKTTTDGYISVNAEMVLQGSARMTLGQTPDETARQKENNEQLYVKYDDPGINTKGTKQAEEEEEEEKSNEDDAEELYDHEGMERVEGNTKETPLTPETAQSVHQGTHDIELTTMHQQSKQNEIGLMRNVDETNVGQDGYREVGEEHRNSTK